MSVQPSIGWSRSGAVSIAVAHGDIGSVLEDQFRGNIRSAASWSEIRLVLTWCLSCEVLPYSMLVRSEKLGLFQCFEISISWVIQGVCWGCSL